MQVSYTKNYLKIYLWQGVSFVLNFVALFIVVPYLSSQPAIYGLYAVCIGLSIFLSYADLGFLSAGQKYAAEYHAQGDQTKETEVIGFTGFILSLILLLLMVFFLYCSFHPGLIVKGLMAGQENSIASALFFILAISVPNTLLQRLLQIIFSIRLHDYVIQRINILGAILRISSIFFFFSHGAYHIVGYYAFTQIIVFTASVIALFIARYRYTYDFRALLKSFRFERQVFNRVKPLALSSLFLTICWIAYYELDPFIIGRLNGAIQVSLFAVGLTLLEFFRSFFGIIFSPFNARFNHFVGQGNINGLKNFFFQVIKTFAPLVVFPIICLVILAPSFVLTWVGEQYQSSIIIVRWLLLCNLLAFVSYPASMLLMGLERIKEMYLISALIVVIYWIGVIFSFPAWGLASFAIFKFLAFLISGAVYISLAAKFLDMPIKKFLYQVLKPLALPLALLLALSFSVLNYLPLTKSKENLFIVLMSAGMILAITFIVQIMSSREIRKKISELFILIKTKYDPSR